ncbi:hypothetical protein BSKO_12257 [Bryopsis sp. KO-2023]|nr:hypothetical protein BSKO_12257 [Bryopsis sp. KO-2023]
MEPHWEEISAVGRLALGALLFVVAALVMLCFIKREFTSQTFSRKFLVAEWSPGKHRKKKNIRQPSMMTIDEEEPLIESFWCASPSIIFSSNGSCSIQV